MVGILLAGGRSTRLYPATTVVNKQLLPIYDKPMIYYPLSILMLAGIRDIRVISTPETIPLLRKLLLDGSQWGLDFSYIEQEEPRGIAEAFLLSKSHIGDDTVFLVLGDNILYGHGLPEQLQRAARSEKGATVFAYAVRDPERYGVVEFNEDKKVISIEEKPEHPRSNYAVPGIYFYDNQAVDIATGLKPSARGELEITDMNNVYIERGELNVEVIGRGTAWLDAGTHEALLQASNYVQAIEERQGILIASPEETAYRMGYIDYGELQGLAFHLNHSLYGKYLEQIPRNEDAPCDWIKNNTLHM